MSNLVIDFQPR